MYGVYCAASRASHAGVYKCNSLMKLRVERDGERQEIERGVIQCNEERGRGRERGRQAVREAGRQGERERERGGEGGREREGREGERDRMAFE